MLEIKNIIYDPEGTHRILDDISLTIPDGKLICLTGPNGGGKTTLAKVIAGVKTQTAGQILLNGQDISALDPTERAKAGIAFAFQQPVRFKGISIRKLLSLAAGHDLSDEELKASLENVGMIAEQYMDRSVDSHLSGGEIKRIEIASVLLRDAKVAIFDEPEAGIDLWSFNNLIRVFEEIRDSRKCSLVIISHQERILSIADEIIMIQSGKLGLSGTRDSIFPRLLCKNECADRGVCVMEAKNE